MTTNTIIATKSAMLMTCRAGNRIGAPLIRAESLRKAITDPVKVMAPIATPIDISTRLDLWMLPTVPMSKALDRKSTRLNSSHVRISYAVFCLKKKKKQKNIARKEKQTKKERE